MTSTETSRSTGWTPGRVRALAPAPFDAFDDVIARLGGAAPAQLTELSRRRVTMLLVGGEDALPSVGELPAPAIEALAGWPTSPVFDDVDRAALELTEQFVIDVAAIDDAQRARCLGPLGADGFGLVQSIYVFDHGLRVRAAIRQLFGVTGGATSARVGTDTDLWPALEEWMRAVARLRSLDPVTTEIVRLRGARAHDCRQCRSLRNVSAVEQGASETVLDQIDRYESSTLEESHKVALRLTDAMLWQPTSFPRGLVGSVHDHYEPEQVVELVLDVARNAANKIAVAFGADAANVVDGVEYYDVDASGDLVYGLAAPAD